MIFDETETPAVLIDETVAPRNIERYQAYNKQHKVSYVSLHKSTPYLMIANRPIFSPMPGASTW